MVDRLFTSSNRLRPSLAKGFTVLEMLVIITVIAILAGISFNAIGDSQAKGRDSQRAADLDTLHSRLEEYYNDNGGYPNTFTASTLPGIDPEVLNDPNGTSLSIQTAVADYVTALATTNPTASGAQYKYIPYPTGCTAITCTGYVLKSYIEKPYVGLPNPYVRTGLNNN